MTAIKPQEHRALFGIFDQSYVDFTQFHSPITVPENWKSMTAKDLVGGQWDTASPLYQEFMPDQFKSAIEAIKVIPQDISSLRTNRFFARSDIWDKIPQSDRDHLTRMKMHAIFEPDSDSPRQILRAVCAHLPWYMEAREEIAGGIIYRDFGLPDFGFLSQGQPTLPTFGQYMPLILVGVMIYYVCRKIASDSSFGLRHGFIREAFECREIHVSEQCQEALTSLNLIYRTKILPPN